MVFALSQSAMPYYAQYKEQFYKLFHVHYQQFPDDVIENIYWLEKATKADFCHPQNALAQISGKDEWEKYRYLFMMHVNLKLIEQHLRLGRIWDKKEVRFYDYPWKEEYLRNTEKSKEAYMAGFAYWKEAKLWAEKASAEKFRFLILTGVQSWEDEREMIRRGDLDYEKILNREISRLAEDTEELSRLNESEY